MNRQIFHVVFRYGWWTVMRNGSRFPYSVHATEELALKSAANVAHVESGFPMPKGKLS